MELPEEGARIQAQALAQFGRREPAGRLLDQGDNGLREVAVAGKADVAMEPKPILIKLRQLRQGIEAAIVIEAGQSAPLLEPAPNGADRASDFLLEFGQGDDFLSPPAPEQRGVRILDPFHGREREFGRNGILYVSWINRHIVCQMICPRASKKPMISRMKSLKSIPPPHLLKHILGHRSLSH